MKFIAEGSEGKGEEGGGCGAAAMKRGKKGEKSEGNISANVCVPRYFTTNSYNNICVDVCGVHLCSVFQVRLEATLWYQCDH